MKSILFVIDDITKGGGTERITITLARNFKVDNIDCKIWSLKKSNDETFYNSEGLAIHYSKRNTYASMLNAVSYAKKNNCIMIIVSMGRLSVEMTLVSRLMMFTEFYCYEHVSYESFSRKIKLLKLMAYSLAKGTIFLTDNDAQLINRKLKKSNVCAIDNISPFKRPTLSNTERKENIVLAAGRFTYQKNFERLIKLWSELNTSSWKLVLVGDGPEKQHLLNLVDDLNIRNITFHAPTSEIEKMYSKAKIFVMTSRYEGFPMVLIEAQTFGLPAIAFDCKTGPSEIIINNNSGFLIDVENNEEFKIKLLSLINDKILLSEMSCNASANASRFTYEAVRTKWFDFLNLSVSL